MSSSQPPPFLLRKMQTQARPLAEKKDFVQNSRQAYHVVYSLDQRSIAEEKEKLPPRILIINELIGHSLSLEWTKNIVCIHCGRKIKKTFNQGYCYVCFTKLARADICAIKPELCHFHQGTCREEAWAQKNCFIPHTLYLAFSDKLKVGITRKRHEKNRWMDQGASLAYPIAQTTSRLDVGHAEVCLKALFHDKTSWQKMLKTRLDTELLEDTSSAILSAAQKAQDALDLFIKESSPSPPKISPWSSSEETASASASAPYEFHYPLDVTPPLLRSLSFEKTPLIQDTLLGIKGQYWIFPNGVLNIRKFAGYEVSLIG